MRFHLIAYLLHLEIVLFLQIIGFSLKLLTKLGLSLVVFCLKGEGVILLAELLFLEGDVESTHVGLECSFFDAVLILQLLKGDLYVFAEFALLILVYEEDMLDPEWEGSYFCLYRLRVITWFSLRSSIYLCLLMS